MGTATGVPDEDPHRVVEDSQTVGTTVTGPSLLETESLLLFTRTLITRFGVFLLETNVLTLPVPSYMS